MDFVRKLSCIKLIQLEDDQPGSMVEEESISSWMRQSLWYEVLALLIDVIMVLPGWVFCEYVIHNE